MFEKSKDKRRHEQAVKKALSELNGIQNDLDQAYTRFNLTTDPSLQDAYIYEISALRAKHTYLLRQMKALEKEERP